MCLGGRAGGLGSNREGGIPARSESAWRGSYEVGVGGLHEYGHTCVDELEGHSLLIVSTPPLISATGARLGPTSCVLLVPLCSGGATTLHVAALVEPRGLVVSRISGQEKASRV